MMTINKFRFSVSALFLLLSGWAYAQDSQSDQADVWATIEGQWDAEQRGDQKWMDRLLTDDFTGWGKTSPAPRSKLSTKMWDRFTDEQGETVAHELYPLAIVIHGDVAIAHYFYTSAYKDNDDEIEIDNGRYSDILVRTDDGWKFIAWHGGDDD